MGLWLGCVRPWTGQEGPVLLQMGPRLRCPPELTLPLGKRRSPTFQQGSSLASTGRKGGDTLLGPQKSPSELGLPGHHGDHKVLTIGMLGGPCPRGLESHYLPRGVMGVWPSSQSMMRLSLPPRA